MDLIVVLRVCVRYVETLKDAAIQTLPVRAAIGVEIDVAGG
jgi:hypothetical protein